MKKILSIVFVMFLLLHTTGCVDKHSQKSNPVEEESISQSVSTKPRPLALRNEIFQNLNAEHKALMAEYNALKEDDISKKEQLKQQIDDNYDKQMEVMNGINGEEKFSDLTEKLEKARDAAQLYIDLGETEKADEIFEMMNIIMYGNKEGKKTW